MAESALHSGILKCGIVIESGDGGRLPGNMKKVLVVIPTYNEAQNVDSVVDAVERVAARSRKYTFELLIVDDHSPDGTAKRVNSLQKKYGNISLSSGRKAGLGRAYIRAFKHAMRRSDCDALVMMDADMSHDPEDIAALLQALDDGADYVIGSRYVTGGTVDASWPLRRVMMSRTANFAARKLVGITDSITDMTGGFKAIRRSSLEAIELETIRASGYIFQVSLLHAFLRQGFQVREVPIRFTDRQNGTSKLRLRDIIEFVYRAYKLNPHAPIQRFVRFGFVGACGSVVNLAVLSLLVRVGHVDVLVAAAIAIEASIVFNFFLNHHYTFKGYGSYGVESRRQPWQAITAKLGKFNIGALGGALISFTTFTMLFKAVHVPYLLADILAIGIAMSWNYFMSTRYVWKAID